MIRSSGAPFASSRSEHPRARDGHRAAGVLRHLRAQQRKNARRFWQWLRCIDHSFAMSDGCYHVSLLCAWAPGKPDRSVTSVVWVWLLGELGKLRPWRSVGSLGEGVGVYKGCAPQLDQHHYDHRHHQHHHNRSSPPSLSSPSSQSSPSKPSSPSNSSPSSTSASSPPSSPAPSSPPPSPSP